MKPFGILQSRANQVDVWLRRRDTLRRFLLKRVKDIDRIAKSARVSHLQQVP